MTMEFSKEGMVTRAKLNKTEGLALGLFLYSEKIRHEMDIHMINQRIAELNFRFKINVQEEYEKRELE